MIETLGSVITSFALAMPFLSILWIYRHTKKINSLNGIFAVVIFAYTLWHFFTMGDHIHSPMHEVVTGLFVIVTALMNVYCSTFANVNVNLNVNRRKEQHDAYGSLTDRRKVQARTIVKNKVPR